MATTKKELELEEFARRVERLCDFLLDKAHKARESGSDDLRVVEDLKDDAADLQFGRASVVTNIFDGLTDYMAGLKPKE